MSVWITKKTLWKILKETGIPDHLICLLRNQYVGQEATVRTGHEASDWFKIEKGIRQGCMLSPFSFNFYAEYIMQNARLDISQARSKISRRNINNFRYADDSTLMAESEEELKSFLRTVKEESEKVDLKLNIEKINHGIQSRHFMANRREKVEAVTNVISLGSKITADGDCSHENKRHLLLGRKAMTKLDSILKGRQHLANKGPYSQSYGFSSSYVQISKLDHKEG